MMLYISITLGVFFLVAVGVAIIFSSQKKKLLSQISELDTKLKEAQLRISQSKAELERALNSAKEEKIAVSSKVVVLQQFSKEVNSTFDLGLITEYIFKTADNIFKLEKAVLYLFDKKAGELKPKQIVGFSSKEECSFSIQSKWLEVIRNKRGVFWREELEKDYNLGGIYKEENIPFEILLPFIQQDELMGLLRIDKCGKKVDQDLIRISSILADLSAMAIRNSIFFKTIKKMAISDGLTGLYTHRIFQMYLKKELLKANRNKENVSLIITDIDHFKSFNDTYGHQTGDFVLSQTAKLISQTVRQMDFVARYGGEEFCVIFPETDKDSAYKVAERIRKKVEEAQYEYNGENLSVTISIGLSSYPVDASNQQDLIKLADLALYRAKEGGRNRVEVANELDYKALLEEKNS